MLNESYSTIKTNFDKQYGTVPKINEEISARKAKSNLNTTAPGHKRTQKNPSRENSQGKNTQIQMYLVKSSGILSGKNT